MEKTKKEGKTMKQFITFEGIDGSGKSTIIEAIYQKLKDNNHAVIKTVEPTDTWIGNCVKRCIETDTDPFVTAFTFVADRIQHGKQITQWLQDGNIVLCDRYAESTYAYQGLQLKDHINNPIQWLQELSEKRIPTPDRTFVFLIDPSIALKRIQNRDNLIPFERISFLEKVQHNYKHLAKGTRFKTINATASIEKITSLCLQDILD